MQVSARSQRSSGPRSRFRGTVQKRTNDPWLERGWGWKGLRPDQEGNFPMAGLQVAKGALARICRCSLLSLSGLALSSCSGVLDPLGPVGAGDAKILIDATVIMLAIVIPTILLAFWMAWRYRASNTRAEYLPYWSYSGRIEALVWSIPILTVMFIGGLIWIGSYKTDPFRPLPSKTPPLEVQVVSLDWKWLFIYPKEGVATVNQLALPVNRQVRFDLTSSNMMNTFYAPTLAGMIYTMPGMRSQLHAVLRRAVDDE